MQVIHADMVVIVAVMQYSKCHRIARCKMKEFVDMLIKKLEEISEPIRPVGWSRKIEVVETKAVIDIVNQLTDDYNNGWRDFSIEIPPYPKKNPLFDNKPLELYFVSDICADYPFRAFWNGKFFTDGFSRVDVVAWQPLPPAFKPKGE